MKIKCSGFLHTSLLSCKKLQQSASAAWKLSLCTLMALSLAACFAKSYSVTIEPTILPMAEFRQSITMEEARDIKVNGKIILYGNYLLVVEPGEGVHVIDSTNAEDPIPLGFVHIWGAEDVVIQNNLLYAKSYIDLVVLDVSNINDIKDDHRVTSAFRAVYPPASYGVDPSEGVITSIARIYK